MKNVIEVSGDVYKLGDVVVVKLKVGQFEKMLDVFKISGNEIVHCNHIEAFFDKFITEVRP